MDARALVIGLSTEAWISRCLHTVAQMRIADKIGDEPRPISDLAGDVGADPRILKTILRILCQRGIFEVHSDNVRQNSASMLLRSDNPVTLGDIVRWNGSQETWRSLEQLSSTLTEGKSGFELAFHNSFFDHLAQHEQTQSLFNRSMEGFTKKQVSSILATLDLTPYQSIVDIGGGTGLLANGLAEKYPNKDISLFDMPGVVGNDRLSPAVSRIAGNFFTDAIPSFDLGILMNVLHDWRDDEAVAILKFARRAARTSSRIFVIEGLMTEGGSSTDLLDLGMAVITGGIQRSRQDFERLLSSAGFEMIEDVRCSEHLSALLARPI